MMDMPVEAAAEMPFNFNLAVVSQTIADYWPVVETVRTIWSYNDLQALWEGRLAVPDSVINEALSGYVANNEGINSVSIESRADGKFMLYTDTEKFGQINLLCRIDDFVHNDKENYLKIKVLEKDIPDNGTLSWIFSRLSLSMAQKAFGRIDFGDDVAVKIKGNNVMVDYSAALNESAAGQTEFMGKSLADMVRIDSAVSREGCLELSTALTVSDEVKAMLQRVVNKTEE